MSFIPIITLSILATVAVIALGNGNIVSQESVIYYKTNDVATTRAKWVATVVIDFGNVNQFLLAIEADVRRAESIVRTVMNNSALIFTEIFVNLRQVIKYLNSLRTGIEYEFSQVWTTHGGRTKRSILPFIGEGLSWLFGLTSENDVPQIRNQVQNLARTQRTIVHVVNESLTLINETRIRIGQNRQSINQIIVSL